MSEECLEYAEACPACGEPVDYCQGHGPMGDPVGYAIIELHNDDEHSLCHPESDCQDAILYPVTVPQRVQDRFNLLMARAQRVYSPDDDPYFQPDKVSPEPF
jgi:hypothetical protein